MTEKVELKKIETEGYHDIKVTDCLVEQKEKNDIPMIFFKMKCVTDDNQYMYHDFCWMHTVIGTGKNEGRKVWEVTKESLERLGIKDGNPGNIAEAIKEGLEGTINVKREEYEQNGEVKKVLRSKGFYPRTNATNIEDMNMDSLLAEFEAAGEAMVNSDVPSDFKEASPPPKAEPKPFDPKDPTTPVEAEVVEEEEDEAPF